MKADILDREFNKIRFNLDKVDTPSLSKIKEIVKRMHFADIKNSQQAYDNKGLAYYQLTLDGETKYFSKPLLLSYTISPKSCGIVYGEFTEKINKEGEKHTEYEPGKFSGYGRFLADLVSGKVIYSKELKSFLTVENKAYTVLDQPAFEIVYYVDNRQKINDFLQVIEEIYRDHINVDTHNFTIEPYKIAGIDWCYDCKNLKPTPFKEDENQLFAAYYDVAYKDLDLEKAENYMDMIAAEKDSLHNLRLVHAYVMLAKMNLISVEHAFILKDFGRTGKGLFMKSFPKVFKMNSVNFDNLTGSGIESSNEWLKFHGCEVSHANESGAINAKSMRYIRKIATQEHVTGRTIGKDTVDFQIKSVLILDTNETVDIGQITANISRTVKIAFKDRPEDETEQERYTIFSPYWEFIQPKGVTSLEAGLSFLISSLTYLADQGGKFVFKDVALKNYAFASQLSSTQEFLLKALQETKYVLSNDKALLDILAGEYGVANFRRKDIRQDLEMIGIEPNYPTTIDGERVKVIRIKNNKLFNKTVSLLLA